MNPKKDILAIGAIAIESRFGKANLTRAEHSRRTTNTVKTGRTYRTNGSTTRSWCPWSRADRSRTGPKSAPYGAPTRTASAPQPDPGLPREVEPTIPGKPAPGLPQREPIPGRPGTIPERTQVPNMAPEDMVITPSHVNKAQDALKANGHNPGTGGKMDPATQQALQEFQKKNNLPATGVLDEKTAAKLGVNLKN